MDGTRGSALYRVPLLLSRVPEKFWASHFVEAWDHPPAWSSMHRPGIASLQGNRIILDGSTIEELERYHLRALKLVVNVLNQKTADRLQAERSRHESEAVAREAQPQPDPRCDRTLEVQRRLAEMLERNLRRLGPGVREPVDTTDL